MIPEQACWHHNLAASRLNVEARGGGYVVGLGIYPAPLPEDSFTERGCIVRIEAKPKGHIETKNPHAVHVLAAVKYQ
jgi:hypothetical protein